MDKLNKIVLNGDEYGIGSSGSGLTNEAKEAIKIEYPTLTLITGKFITNGDSIASDGSFAYTEPVAVSKGDYIVLTATGYLGSVGMISTCNSDGSGIAVQVVSNGSTEQDYTYIAADSGYVCFSFMRNKPYKVTIITADSMIMRSYLSQNLTENLEPQFNIGDIAISASGWTYNASVNSRVSTKQGYTFHCKPGDIIGLSDYTAARFYIGWRLADGTYGTGGQWFRKDYVVKTEADYVINITAVPEATVSDMTALSSLFKYIIHKETNDIYEIINSKQDEIDSINESINGLNNPMLIPGKLNFAMHRGYSAVAPENTIPAFQLAGKAGVFGIETDVYETSDGHFVCIHDTTVDAMTDGTGTVYQMTFAQVEACTIDAGNNIGQYPGLKIPTFESYLQICKQYGCVAVIDIKVYYHLENLIEIVKNYGMLNSCVFMTTSTTVLDRIVSMSPHSMLALVKYANEDISAAITSAANYKNCIVAANAGLIASASPVTTAHGKNVPVASWTVDDNASAVTALSYGVDIIISNTLTKIAD